MKPALFFSFVIIFVVAEAIYLTGGYANMYEPFGFTVGLIPFAVLLAILLVRHLRRKFEIWRAMRKL